MRAKILFYHQTNYHSRIFFYLNKLLYLDD